MRCEMLTAAEFAKSQTEGLGERVREVVWFTGIDVPRYDLWTGEEWILRLPMSKARIERLNAGAPLMKDHTFRKSVDDQVGVFEKAWIDGKIGRGYVKFADTADVADLVRKVDDGIVKNLSMEAVIDDFKDVTPRGSKGPKILEATGWEVEAVALVAVPADPNAKVMLSASPMPRLSLTSGGCVDLTATVEHLSAEAGAASETEKPRFDRSLLEALRKLAA